MGQGLKRAGAWVLSIGADPTDSEEERRKKQGVVYMAAFCAVGMPLDALLGIQQGVNLPFYSLLLSGIVPGLVLAVIAWTRRRQPVQELMLVTLLVLPGTLHAGLGGTQASGTILIWSGVAPVLGTFFSPPALARGYFIAYFLGANTLIWLDPVWSGEVASPNLALFDLDFLRRTLAPVWFPTLVFVVTQHIQQQLASTRQALQTAEELGSYTLESRLGAGGMGEVWRASHRMLARPAAIKLIHPDALKARGSAGGTEVFARFEREAQATARLTSPHTVKVFDYGRTDDGTFYYAMELLEGIDLQTLVRRFGPLSPERVVYLLSQACASLVDAHDMDFVHRDIKPANLFCCRLGRQVDFLKVLDFGLVVRQVPGRGGSDLTQDHMVGTPTCMAPEMATGGEIGPATDLYALGCVAYELLTGRPVFERQTGMATIAAHIGEPAPPVSQATPGEIPLALEHLVMSCLEKDATLRPQQADLFSAHLRAIPFDDPWTESLAVDWWQENLPAKAVGASPSTPTVPDGLNATIQVALPGDKVG